MLTLAAKTNEWFRPNFIKLMRGNTLELPVEIESVDVTAQNCLFNIFEPDDLTKALGEMYRVIQ